MHQMREHGTPGDKALSRRVGGATVRSAPDRIERKPGYKGGRAKCKMTGMRPARARNLCSAAPRCRKLNLIRSVRAKHVADFPQLLPLRNSQISPRLLYRTCKQELTNKKRVPCVYASRSIAVYSGWISGIGGRCSLARRSSGCLRSLCEGCDRHDNCARRGQLVQAREVTSACCAAAVLAPS